MKCALCLSAFSLLLFQEIGFAQYYQNGDTLNVVATSGLRLRTSPGSNAGTIRVLEFGEEVIVKNTFGFDSTYQDKSGWFTGNWISVSAGQVSGFVFDGFLSKLPLPNHENELCMESSLSFSVPLQHYITHHFPVVADENGSEHREDVDQCVSYHSEGIVMTRTNGDGWYKTDVTFTGYRLSEVVNVFRSMIVGEDMLDAFESSLRFHKNKSGQINKVQAGSESFPLLLKVEHDGSISVSITELTAG